jgi:hypothetical protein
VRIFLGVCQSDRNIPILLQKYTYNVGPILLPYLQNTLSNNIVNILGDEAIIININGDCIFGAPFILRSKSVPQY